MQYQNKSLNQLTMCYLLAAISFAIIYILFNVNLHLSKTNKSLSKTNKSLSKTNKSLEEKVTKLEHDKLVLENQRKMTSEKIEKLQKIVNDNLEYRNRIQQKETTKLWNQLN